MQYRADISGLRALAVIPVVLFHADPHLMPGGFVGVDVFFVISGYLITSLIAADMQRQRFSLLHFYDRRVRRILPAYGVVALVTALAAVILYPPNMLAAFGASLKSASTFLANQHFLSVTNYFGPGVSEQPLLHTWSLAVEEQFYLFWPLLLLLLFHPRLEKARPYVVGVLILASLALATKNAVVRPERAFFNFTGRAWELLVGASLALGFLPALRSQKLAEIMAASGIVLIIGACIFFSEGMVFPGATALVPTLGALFILWAGADGRSTRAGQFLAREPLAFIGLISYSLYLWHWPLFAFARLYLGPHLPALTVAGLILAAVAVSALSWRFVEVPMRRGGLHGRGGEWRPIAAGLAMLALLVGVGTLFTTTGGLPGRASALARDTETRAVYSWPPKSACFLGPNRFAVPADCRFGDADPTAPLMALWGDSFANQHGPALDALARQDGFGLLQMTKAGCAPEEPPPSALRPRAAEAEACNRFRADSLTALLENSAIRLVVVAGNWPSPGKEDAELPQLQAAVEKITASGRGVILVAPAVGFENGGGRCLVRRRFLGLDDRGCAVPLDAAKAGLAPVETALMRIAHGSPLVRLVVLWPRLCDKVVCQPMVDGQIAMIDGGHLNAQGSLAFADDFRRALESLRPLLPAAPASPR